MLTDAEVSSLHEALDDEYRAWSMDDQVFADFGDVRPSVSIRGVEVRHIETLAGPFTRYDPPLPANPWLGCVPRYAGVQAACEAGMAAEIGNGSMYERRLATHQRSDIATVLLSVQQASQQRHLSTGQRCAKRCARRGGACGGHREKDCHGRV